MKNKLTARQITALHGEQEKLADLVQRFLLVNPKPSDQQFHAFAESLGVDKESLEAIAYQLLSEYERGKRPVAEESEQTQIESELEEEDEDLEEEPFDEAPSEVTNEDIERLLEVESMLLARRAKLKALTVDEKILEGEEDPETMPSDKVMLNDGDPAYNSDPGFQQETTDDGVSSTDIGVGLDGDQSVLNDDGVVSPRFVESKLEASLRTELTAALLEQGLKKYIRS